jgi:hypothetical protein
MDAPLMKNWLPLLVKNLEPLIESVGIALDNAAKAVMVPATVEKRMIDA